ncbi:DUF885 domain-containing protein [Tessaracoccus sp. OH4464_COT-324]|uniref:DUF885 domain-containing protein n=1 Tax=Tessaracoccus sp. OH4464_COT-324 TaxID=2491059 RepID=UPI000F63F580|nr:DUF885 domain-containing protein [Tessaracoccus sp. OH4464_COT-324]RRD46025.1 DUF885 domain-containing protein [Tessaracoccus sp. OH4464_COT-324]
MTREKTPLDAVADGYVAKLADLDPIAATSIGLPGHDHLLTDYSPDGHAARAELDRATLAAVDATADVDDVDRVTRAAMRERLGLQLELHEAGETLAALNNISSPLQALRDVFDLMPTATVEQWEVIAERMRRVPEAADGYLASLRAATVRPAKRQFDICAEQTDNYARPDGFWASFAAGARPEEGELPGGLRDELAAAAESARAAFGLLAEGLRELRPSGADADAVGRERYARFSRLFLGAGVDFDETYRWGQEELARIVAEQGQVAERIGGPGTTVEAAIELLNNDPARKLVGVDALQHWMQATSDAAIEELGREHFDIPEPVRRLECCIAPTATGGIYYTGPSDDFSRPGRMWWSVPEGVSEFTTWLEKTTVYHEGVPGHHLQLAQAVYRSDLLNSWRRNVCWVSGHGEGWALYAERLMHSLGYLDEPGDYLGMLDGQRMRAARVVLDIGFHLGLPHPDGGEWSYERAWDFLKANAGAGDDFLRFELHRYLGWPGQAPSYKIGQRLWEQIRDELSAREGAAFDLKAFHRRALDVGSVGLDVLRSALLG